MGDIRWRDRINLALEEPENLPPDPTELYDKARDRSVEIERLYEEAIRTKRMWARSIRIVSILLATIGALLPTLWRLVTDNGRPVIPPFWASVALGAAAGLLLIDYYLRISESWQNCVLAENAIRGVWERLFLELQIEKISWADNQAGAEEAVRVRSKIPDLLGFMQSIVATETRQSSRRGLRATTVSLLKTIVPQSEDDSLRFKHRSL